MQNNKKTEGLGLSIGLGLRLWGLIGFGLVVCMLFFLRNTPPGLDIATNTVAFAT